MSCTGKGRKNETEHHFVSFKLSGDILVSVPYTQDVYYCKKFAYTVKTWLGITNKSTINVVIRLILSAYPCTFGLILDDLKCTSAVIENIISDDYRRMFKRPLHDKSRKASFSGNLGQLTLRVVESRASLFSYKCLVSWCTCEYIIKQTRYHYTLRNIVNTTWARMMVEVV